MLILVSTLGFDEKFVIRFLMRYAGNFSTLYIITAEPIEERVERALSLVRDFVKRYLNNVSLKLVTVDPKDYLSAVARIKEVFRENITETFAINVSGGMRALIVELIVAALLSRVNGYLEIELENFSGVVKIPMSTFLLTPLSSEEYIIVREVISRGEVSAKELIKVLGMPRSSVYKYLKELVRKKVLEVVRESKTSRYKASELAKLLL